MKIKKESQPYPEVLALDLQLIVCSVVYDEASTHLRHSLYSLPLSLEGTDHKTLLPNLCNVTHGRPPHNHMSKAFSGRLPRASSMLRVPLRTYFKDVL